MKTKILILSLLIFNSVNASELSTGKNLDELIFCFVGDTGEVTKTQALVADSLAQSDCSMIWHTGDIIYPSGIDRADDPEFTNKFLIPFEEVLKNGIPFYLTLGNHDYKKDTSGYLDIAKNNPLIHYPHNYYLEEFGNVCFVALDTTIFDKLYFFFKRGKQIEWLESVVESYKDSCNFSIAVAHHPFFSSGDREKASPQLSTFLEEYVFGVFDLYITGHNHVLADEGDYLGTTQLISATGSLPGGSPDTAPENKFNVETPGFLKLTFSNTGESNYEFVRSSDGAAIWSKTKKGLGLRVKDS
jgi:tartrate-resistant acid phosphatase type 5